MTACARTPLGPPQSLCYQALAHDPHPRNRYNTIHTRRVQKAERVTLAAGAEQAVESKREEGEGDRGGCGCCAVLCCVVCARARAHFGTGITPRSNVVKPRLVPL
eukprot:gene23313-biopygen5818